MELIRVMEGITLCATLGMIMTGIPPCLNMYRTKSTKNIPYPIFLLSALSSLGMFHYGLMIDNPVLIFLNGVGSVMQTIYVLTYLLVINSKTKPLVLLLAAVVYDIMLYSYMYTTLTVESRRAETLGMCCGLINTVIMCLPALELRENIKNKNADGMPYVMLIGGMICSSCWLIYGMMLGDPNIYTPNIPGLCIASLKLYIISLYGKKKIN